MEKIHCPKNVFTEKYMNTKEPVELKTCILDHITKYITIVSCVTYDNRQHTKCECIKEFCWLQDEIVDTIYDYACVTDYAQTPEPTTPAPITPAPTTPEPTTQPVLNSNGCYSYNLFFLVTVIVFVVSSN